MAKKMLFRLQKHRHGSKLGTHVNLTIAGSPGCSFPKDGIIGCISFSFLRAMVETWINC